MRISQGLSHKPITQLQLDDVIVWKWTQEFLEMACMHLFKYSHVWDANLILHEILDTGYNGDIMRHYYTDACIHLPGLNLDMICVNSCKMWVSHHTENSESSPAQWKSNPLQLRPVRPATPPVSICTDCVTQLTPLSHADTVAYWCVLRTLQPTHVVLVCCHALTTGENRRWPTAA